MAHCYLNEQLTPAHLGAGCLVTISGDEGRHAVRVSRLRAGEQILIGNGAGALAQCEVMAVERDRFEARVLHLREIPAPTTRVVLVQALAKSGRDERAVEQATEFGVDALVPWQSERSVSRWHGTGTGSGEGKSEKGLAKWARSAREAAKQSLNPWVPELREVVTLAGVCQMAKTPGTRVLVLHPAGDVALTDVCGNLEVGRDREIAIVVGSEGGITEAELVALRTAGALVVRLGSTVLRTSSAGPAALAIVNVALGRW